MMRPAERILCALDTKSADDAQSLARQLKGVIGGIKLGLEFFTAAGPDGFAEVADAGLPIFLDLKFHDIPNTVAQAVASVVPLGPFMLNVHASGGAAMMRAAADSAGEAASKAGIAKPKVIGVTVLTSLDRDDLNAAGMQAPVEEQAVRLASLAKASGLDGVVCSAKEVRAIRAACGEDFTLVTPGIRPAARDDDQKRVVTPAEAVALGSDYLVIGRPITAAADPARAASDIADSLAPLEPVA